MHRTGGGREGRGEVSFDMYDLPFFWGFVRICSILDNVFDQVKQSTLSYFTQSTLRYAEAKPNLYLTT